MFVCMHREEGTCEYLKYTLLLERDEDGDESSLKMKRKCRFCFLHRTSIALMKQKSPRACAAVQRNSHERLHSFFWLLTAVTEAKKKNK